MDKRGKNVGTFKSYKGKKVVNANNDKSPKDVEPAKIDMT